MRREKKSFSILIINKNKKYMRLHQHKANVNTGYCFLINRIKNFLKVKQIQKKFIEKIKVINIDGK